MVLTLGRRGGREAARGGRMTRRHEGAGVAREALGEGWGGAPARVGREGVRHGGEVLRRRVLGLNRFTSVG